MVVINSNISAIKTNINGLNSPIKKNQDYHAGLKIKTKQKPETYLKHKDPQS